MAADYDQKLNVLIDELKQTNASHELLKNEV
jgi:hypothetical protein